jgi:hypothetical protein
MVTVGGATVAVGGIVVEVGSATVAVFAGTNVAATEGAMVAEGAMVCVARAATVVGTVGVGDALEAAQPQKQSKKTRVNSWEANLTVKAPRQ